MTSEELAGSSALMHESAKKNQAEFKIKRKSKILRTNRVFDP